MSKIYWNKVYLQIKTDLENGLTLNPKQVSWVDYQRIRKLPISPEQINLLNELNVLTGKDWKIKEIRINKERMPKKRNTIIGLGDRIKDARIKHGYNTVNEFSGATNIAISTIKDWENEISIPSCDRLITLCKLFSVSADYLLFGTKKSK